MTEHQPMTALDAIADRVRRWNTTDRYDWGTAAAARLCADSPTALAKVAQFVDDDGWIEWEQLTAHVDQSGWSSGEKAIIRLACSLAGYAPKEPTHRWLLDPMLRPLDSDNAELVIAAIRLAVTGRT